MSFHDGLKPMALFNTEISVSPQRRAVQAVLASIQAVPALAEHLLEGHGPRRTRLVKFSPLSRTGPRTDEWTPEAAIFISNSNSSWLGLVANSDDVGDFEAALAAVRAGKADIVICISSGAGHPERAAGLPVIDWTVASLRAACEISAHHHQPQSPAEALILRDLIGILNDPVVAGPVIDAVPTDIWTRILQGKGATELRQIGEQIAIELSRAIAQNLTVQKRGEKDATGFAIPIRGAAADLNLQIDPEHRRIAAAMTLSAGRMARPLHEVVTWLASQLQTRDERAQVTITRTLGNALTLTPEMLQSHRAPTTGLEDPVELVEVRMCMDLGENLLDGDLTAAALLELALDFYGEIGQHLEAWRPAPPRLIRPRGQVQPAAGVRKPQATPAVETAAAVVEEAVAEPEAVTAADPSEAAYAEPMTEADSQLDDSAVADLMAEAVAKPVEVTAAVPEIAPTAEEPDAETAALVAEIAAEFAAEIDSHPCAETIAATVAELAETVVPEAEAVPETIEEPVVETVAAASEPETTEVPAPVVASPVVQAETAPVMAISMDELLSEIGDLEESGLFPA